MARQSTPRPGGRAAAHAVRIARARPLASPDMDERQITRSREPHAVRRSRPAARRGRLRDGPIARAASRTTQIEPDTSRRDELADPRRARLARKTRLRAAGARAPAVAARTDAAARRRRAPRPRRASARRRSTGSRSAPAAEQAAPGRLDRAVAPRRRARRAGSRRAGARRRPPPRSGSRGRRGRSRRRTRAGRRRARTRAPRPCCGRVVRRRASRPAPAADSARATPAAAAAPRRARSAGCAHASRRSPDRRPGSAQRSVLRATPASTSRASNARSTRSAARYVNGDARSKKNSARTAPAPRRPALRAALLAAVMTSPIPSILVLVSFPDARARCPRRTHVNARDDGNLRS